MVYSTSEIKSDQRNISNKIEHNNGYADVKMMVQMWAIFYYRHVSMLDICVIAGYGGIRNTF